MRVIGLALVVVVPLFGCAAEASQQRNVDTTPETVEDVRAPIAVVPTVPAVADAPPSSQCVDPHFSDYYGSGGEAFTICDQCPECGGQDFSEYDSRDPDAEYRDYIQGLEDGYNADSPGDGRYPDGDQYPDP